MPPTSPWSRRRAGAFARSLLAALLVTTAAGGAACTGRGKNAPAPEQARATVRVENRSFDMVTIHAVRGSQRVRLGQVSASATTTFRIPPSILQPGERIVITATRLASNRRAVAEAFAAAAGGEFLLVVPPG